MTEQQNNQEHEKRREASAKFIIQNTESDSSLDLRDAMETAHRSLADSLQLSFRALQIVMIVLLGLYLVSGFRTVEDSQTGVSTFFGKIPFLRIDYILHSPKFKTTTFTTHQQELSDHKAIESSFGF